MASPGQIVEQIKEETPWANQRKREMLREQISSEPMDDTVRKIDDLQEKIRAQAYAIRENINYINSLMQKAAMQTRKIHNLDQHDQLLTESKSKLHMVHAHVGAENKALSIKNQIRAESIGTFTKAMEELAPLELKVKSTPQTLFGMEQYGEYTQIYNENQKIKASLKQKIPEVLEVKKEEKPAEDTAPANAS